MTTLRRNLRQRIAKAFRAFKRSGLFNKHASFRFERNAYYITLGSHDSLGLMSVRPYYRWKQARRAAKKLHHKAFITRGATLERLLKKAD